ncbi:MAG: hypothetical protein ABJB11_06300 [Ferruginibacter sp.]
MTIYLKDLCTNSTKKVVMCLLLVAAISKLTGQSIETSIVQSFDAARKNALQEKMFVHTDKDFYLAGEICWFKIYTVDAFFHQPLDLSTVAYAELLDKNNQPVIQAKISLKSGGGDGSVYIPFTLNSGYYKLRAYSKWMKNFGPDYYFEKAIRIINTQQIPILSKAPVTPLYDIQFFPEGGNLVNGIQSKVAFKVLDQKGIGTSCTGILVNDHNDTLQKFETTKFGMGNFMFTPVARMHYSAIINLPDGKKVVKDLPVAYNNGYVMHLEPGSEKLTITVQATANENGQQPAIVYLFVHTRGSVKTALTANVSNGIASFSVSKSLLGDGISHFTVFNNKRLPVCERLYFKNPAEKLVVKMTTDEKVYGFRKKITIGINANGNDAKPLEADMSMAVYKVDSLQSPAASGIGEYLWLSSDLPGNIESPEYYFNNTNDAAKAADNLMLTNGWRRFRWEDILKDKKPMFTYEPECNGHVITGKVINSLTNSPAPGVDAYFSVPGTTRFRTAVSDPEGRLRFEIKNFVGTPGIILQAKSGNATTYQVQIDNPFDSSYSPGKLPLFEMPVKAPLTLQDQNTGMQVLNIYHGDTIRKLDVTMVDTSKFFGYPNQFFLLDNYVRFATMEEVLREYVSTVNVRRRGGKYHLPVFNDGEVFGEIFDNDPLVLLDGVPVFDMDKIIQYDPLKVRTLESVTRKYFYGHQAFDGIVNLKTYHGNLEGFELDPTATVLDYEGLQLQREFYSPVYETPEQISSHLPDFRNVLNWLPNIKTGKSGKYQTVFYSADLPGKYVAVVQALTADGKTASSQVFFEIK